MAVTDHRLYNYDNFGVEGITILPGMEMDGNFPRIDRAVHCHHIVCVGPRKEDGNGYDQDQQFERWTIEKPEDTQAHLNEIHSNGNLTVSTPIVSTLRGGDHWFFGVSGITRRELEELHEAGETMRLKGYGVLVVDDDCDEEMLFSVVEEMKVRGKVCAADSIKKHYGLK